MNEKQSGFLDLSLTAAQKKTLRRLILSRSKDKAVQKLVILPKEHKGDTLYIEERYLCDGKKLQKNYAEFPAEKLGELLPEFSQGNLITGVGECEYRSSKSGTFTLIGDKKLRSALTDAKEEAPAPLEHKKNYLLRGDEPFLRELGITDETGRIRDKRQAKFRQICRFLEYVRDMLPHLPKERLVVYDLCCGKSYLSFAVYHDLTVTLGRQVEMLCVDRKADVMAECDTIAKKLGYTGMHFAAADITTYPYEKAPDLVLSLHACDIATDIVLQTAARLGAGVILSTPCCHRDLSRRIDCAPLAFATRESILRSKLCDALTDSMRLAFLEKEGYRTDACELVDPDDTPKNVLLRAVRRRASDFTSAEAEKKAAEYAAIQKYLGI